jgi:TRAP-type C4-dicarboxylate transport system substrate-binding protein
MNQTRHFPAVRILLPFLLILLLSPTNASAVRLKIATLSPEGSFWMTQMEAGAEEVKKRTDGRVSFRFYPGGVMGDDRAMLRKIRVGQLHGGAVVLGSLADVFPDSQAYAIPLELRGFDEVDFVRKRVDPYIMNGLEEGGFVTFGLAEGGFAYIMSTRQIGTVSDLQAAKAWVPDNDQTALEAVKAFEVTPVPLSIADVRAGLQTGLIDTVATPPIGAVALQWHTQIQYLTDMPFLYVCATLAVDKRAFSKVKPEDQAVVREVMAETFRKLDRRNREDNVAALEALKGQGVEFVQPSDAALEDWRARAETVPGRLVAAGRLSPEVVAMLEAALAEYRNGKSGS